MPKTPWFIAAAAIGFSGFVIAGASHQNLASAIDKTNPGKLQVDYFQPGAGVGKFWSFACAVGVSGSLWMGLKDEESKSEVKSQEQEAARDQSTPAPKQQATQSAKKTAAAPVYDEDPEIEVESDEAEVEEPQQPVAKKSAEALIFERMYSNHKRHILIPAETGAGKTTLLLGAIEYGHDLFDGQIEYFGSTAKRSPWLGLEDQLADDGKPRILFVDPDQPSTIKPLLERLRWLRKRLVKRGEIRTKAEKQGQKCNPRRNCIILDEWNVTLAIAKEYDREYNLALIDKNEPRSDAYGELLAIINLFTLMGREDEMAIWVFGQDHQVQNAGINTGYRKNLAIMVPAMQGNMMGMEEALTGRTSIVSSTPKGRQILAQAEAVADANPSVGICYSNIQGHEILITPHLPDIKRKRLFEASDRKVVKGRFPQAVGSNYQPDQEQLPQAVGASNYQPDQEQLEDYWS